MMRFSFSVRGLRVFLSLAILVGGMGIDPCWAEETGGDAAAVPPPMSEGLLPLPDYSGDFKSSRYLSGDWDGRRNALASKGIFFDVQWTQAVQSNVHGGSSTGTRYGGSLDYNLTLDLQRMGVMPGALVKMRAESKYGESINDHVGTLLPANIDALFPLKGPLDNNIALTLTSLNYTQFLSEHFAITIGKYDTLDGDPNEFASGRGVSQFMNGNFVLSSPLALIVPYSTIGGGVVIIPNKYLMITGLLVNTADSSTTSGFDDIGDGWTLSGEAQYQYQICNLPGGVNAGFAYAFDTAFTKIEGRFAFKPGEGLAPTTEDESWVVYFSGWQYIYTEEPVGPGAGPMNLANGEADLQGVGLFFRLAFADEDTNPVDFYTSIGVGGKGVIPCRDADTFGVAYYYMGIQDTRISGVVGIDDSTQGVELFYNIAVTPAAHLTLDVQVIDSAATANDTATVLGMRLNLKF